MTKRNTASYCEYDNEEDDIDSIDKKEETDPSSAAGHHCYEPVDVEATTISSVILVRDFMECDLCCFDFSSSGCHDCVTKTSLSR